MKQRNSKRNAWQDHYTRQARKDRYPARSVYKLEEIQKKSRPIRTGDRVLDLGCAPGAWLLYAARLAGPTGRVVGIDLNPVEVAVPANAGVHVRDVRSLDAAFVAAEGGPFHVVMSDMAPSTTGQREVDAARSLDLCEAALAVARMALAEGGSFICKIFQGEGFKPFSEAVRAAFHQHKIFKPQSSRKASREIYIIGLGKQQEE